jgi:hypothetical protein
MHRGIVIPPHADPRFENCAITMATLDETVADCAGAVLIISDACHAHPRWTDGTQVLTPEMDSSGAKKDEASGQSSADDPNAAGDGSRSDSADRRRFKLVRDVTNDRPTRLFIGYAGYALDWADFPSGILTAMIYAGMSGQADSIRPQTFSDHQSTANAVPDGYVTLREVSEYIRLMSRGAFRGRALLTITVEGRFAGEDDVLSKYVLPLDFESPRVP